MTSATEQPIIISDEDCHIFGILRHRNNKNKLLILLPALTGTRIGPQGLYIHISKRLLNKSLASLCLEFPPSGDSYDLNDQKISEASNNTSKAKYEFYLTKVINYLKANFDFKEIIILSISAGCFPALYLAQKLNHKQVFLLSPVFSIKDNSTINKKNIRNYFIKFYNFNTWKKVFLFKLNIKNIFSNVFNLKKKRQQTSKIELNAESFSSKNVNALCIFGEKDFDLNNYRLFWKSYLSKGNIESYQERIIQGADHSFFGWQFKEKISDIIISQLLK